MATCETDVESPDLAAGGVDNSGFGSNPGYNRITGSYVAPAVPATCNGDLGGYRAINTHATQRLRRWLCM